MFVIAECVEYQLPVYSSTEAAGADLKSNEDVTIYPGKWMLVGTGVRLEMPKGVVGLIHPRSGLALKHGITVLNAPGTIDSDYRGEIKVLLYNANTEPFDIAVGDRIAQIVFQQYLTVEFLHGRVTEDTDRGVGGFGSTGIKS
jgi:dUTP pyrophosphatase